MEVYFEIIQFGATSKVTAIDSVTGTEVVIQGPTSLGPHSLKATALAKLKYVLSKQTTTDSR